MVNITKLYTKPDASGFDAFGRVLSGTLKPGPVHVLGEGYSPDDEEDMATAVIDHIWIYNARYRYAYLLSIHKYLYLKKINVFYLCIYLRIYLSSCRCLSSCDICMYVCMYVLYCMGAFIGL